MDFSFWEISLLFFLLIITLIFLIFSATSSRNLNVKPFTVIDFVRALKKVCPVTHDNKWQLLSLSLGPCRTWIKKFYFPAFKHGLNIYGTVCTATCSPMYALSHIADISRFGEWNILYPPTSLLIEPFADDLKEDDFMVVDQVIDIHKGTNVQPFTSMYRFLSKSEKSTKWLLYWNAKGFEFMFFLIQPAISRTVHCQSVVTYIFGKSNPSYSAASTVAEQMRNIKDFLCISQLHIIGSSFSPSTPILSVRESISDAPVKEINQSEAKTPPISCSSFTLVPVVEPFVKYGWNTLKGFQVTITLSSQETVVLPKPEKNDEISTPVSANVTLRRTVSETCIPPNQLPKPQIQKIPIDSETNRRNSLQHDSKAKMFGLVKQKSLDIIQETTDGNSKHNSKSSSASTRKSQSFTESAGSSSEKQKLVFLQSDASELLSDEDSFVNLQTISETAEENSGFDKYELFNSSTSDFEIIDSAQQYLACKLADFLTQGNYGASELQAEMMFVSQYNDKLGPGEQGPGCWVYHSTHKGIAVLTKTIAGRFMKIVSFLCQTELSVPVSDVWKCVKNPRFRFICDETVKTVKIIERISNTQKLVHVYHESSGFLRKECIDFCLLQTEREEENRYYSSFHSIEYEKCPLMTSVLRGSLRPSGWVVEKVGSKKCKVTYLVQILVSSPDSLYLQELSNLVPQSLHHLKHYTASNPK